MHRSLFLLCPTDCLESVINTTYRHQNYFYTSLGNSFSPSIDTLTHIKKLIKQHDIRRIYFVLSKDNSIILDALGHQLFSDVKGLEPFYNNIIKQKKHSEVLWQKEHWQFSILSHYLNEKIKELRVTFQTLLHHPIYIRGKIYDRDKATFEDIHSELFCVKKHLLN